MAGELVERTVEIFVDGAWLDITADALDRDQMQLTRGVPDRGGAASPGTYSGSLRNIASRINGVIARYALRNPRSDLFGKLGPNTPIRLSAGLTGSTPTVRTVQEIVTLPPRWDVSGQDRWVPLSGSGILRRLGIPSSPLDPALSRAAPREPGVLAHWSLAGLGADVTLARSSVAGVRGLVIRNGHLADWSGDDTAPGLGACPAVTTASTDVLAASGPVPSEPGPWGLGVWGRGDLDEDLSADLVMTVYTTSNWWVLTAEWRAATSDISINIQVYDPDADTTLALLSNTDTIQADARWRNIALVVNAPIPTLTVFVDGVAVDIGIDSGSLIGVDVGDIDRVDVRASLLAGRGLSLGGLTALQGVSVVALHDVVRRLYTAGLGFVVEPAGDRAERLCLEQGVSLAGPGADVADDDFGRTETDGWGAAPSGQAWTTEGGDAADYSVSSGQAHIEIDTVDSVRQTYLAVDVADVDVYATFYPNQIFTGGEAQAGITVRTTRDVDDLYQFALFFHEDQSLTATIAARDAGVTSVLHQVQALTPITYDASSAIRVRGQVRGTLLRMKLWDAADPEPTPWYAEVENGQVAAAGQVGVRMALDTAVSNALPVTMSVDDIVIRTAPMTALMGPQHPAEFLAVLGECATLEAAGSRAPILTEQRAALGLEFTPLSSLYLPRTPDLTLDYEEGQLAPPFDPTPDDFGLVNDATASRRDGGSDRVQRFAGPKGISAADRYDAAEEFVTAADEYLDGIARWWTLHSTWDEDRYPSITINMRSLSTRVDGAALVAAVQALDEGALIVITNLPEEITEDIGQIVLGITETISTEEWTVELHTTPAGPFRVGVRGDVDLSGSRSSIVADGEHNAFPGAVQLVSGDVLVSWRAAPQHAAGTGANRGIIHTSRTADGINWTVPAVAVDSDPDDSRGQMLAQLGNGDVSLSYWTDDGAGALDTKVRLSTDDGATWGAAVDVVTGFDDDLCTCPMRDLGGGSYGIALYARTGAANWSAIWQPLTAAGAADGSPVTIADGPTDGRNYTEPYVVVLSGGDLLCLIRETDGGQIWSSRSTDGGASWTGPTARFAAIGRPSFIELADGRLLVVCRRPATLGVDQAHIIRLSGDGGVTWTQEQVLDAESGRSVYAEPVQLADGRVGFAYAIENSTTNSDLSWRAGPVVIGSAEPVRRSPSGSSTDASFVAGTDTSLSVATTVGPLWGVTGQGNMSFPLDVGVDGVRLRVTGISGASSPQTFTVDQAAVNGIAKTIPSGTPVVLWRPAVRGLWG